MANDFYNRGASFNPDELADGDAIEAEFDAIGRGFDTIEDLVNANQAGYPAQTFHVAEAVEPTHAVPKAQMETALSLKLDAVNYNASDILTKLKTVDGTGSGLDADLLDGHDSTYYRNASNINAGTLAKERLPASIDASTTGNAATATKTTATAAAGATADLVKGAMGGNDFFRIRVGGNTDAGWTEIATADNGDEPIYIRQYTGDFVSVARTLTLLDGNGDTLLPGKLKAASSAGGVELYSNNTGIYPGNGDNCSSTVNNLKLQSWYGIGFSPSITGQPIPFNEYSHYFNTRTGETWFRGDLNLAANVNFNGKTVFGGTNDAWLRLNPDAEFGSGIYCGASVVRTDGDIEIGAGGVSLKVTSAGKLTAAGEIISKNADAYRLIGATYGSYWRTTGNMLYLLLTAAADQYGAHNTLRPMTVDMATGRVTFSNGLSGNLTGDVTGKADTAVAAENTSFWTAGGVGENQIGVRCDGYASAYLYSNSSSWGIYSAGAGNAVVRYDRASGTASFGGNATTATTLQTARTINSVSFNGGANITVEPYVELDSTAATRYLTFVDSGTAGYQRLNMDGGLTYNPSTNILTTSVSGNATSATKLQTARTIALSGDVTGSVDFNGSENATISVNLIDSSVMAIAAAGAAGRVGTYAFLKGPSSDYAFGATLAGSSLLTSGMYIGNSNRSAAIYTGGAAVSGTWRCMGHLNGNDGGFGCTAATLWLRIS